MNSASAALSKSLYHLRRFSRLIWVRSALIALLGVVAAAGSGVLAPLIPDKLAEAIEPQAVETILQILSSGMLAVVIFSLSVMVSARQSASQQATPRSHQLLLEDTTTQNVLATFLGAFLFSLVGVITLGTAVYSGNAAAVILGFTLLVILMMIVAILRWISHLSDLGSVVATTRRVDTAARSAMDGWVNSPCMGGTAFTGQPPGTPTPCNKSGYIQHVDIEKLSDLAEKGDYDIYVCAVPGTFLAKGRPLAFHTGAPDLQALHDAFTMGDARRFDQDPRFGVIVLSEIAQRALSPGVNDPGTAIDVLTRQHRLLIDYAENIDRPGQVPLYPRVHVPPMSAEDLLRDAFDPIARDGAEVIEVQIRLQRVLSDLASRDNRDVARAARAASDRARDHARQALRIAADRDRLNDRMEKLFG